MMGDFTPVYDDQGDLTPSSLQKHVESKRMDELARLREENERLLVGFEEMTREAVFLLNHAENAPMPVACTGPPMWLIDCRERIEKTRAALKGGE